MQRLEPRVYGCLSHCCNPSADLNIWTAKGEKQEVLFSRTLGEVGVGALQRCAEAFLSVNVSFFQ